MEIFIFDDVRPEGRGNISNPQKQTYRQLEQRLQMTHMTHGNIIGHLYGNIVDQVSFTRDQKAGRIGGRHINDYFSRAMYFCHYLRHKYSLLYYNYQKTGNNNLPPGFKLQELYQGYVALYNKQIIKQLTLDGKAEFMRYARDSKTHVDEYTNPNEYLGETYVHDRHDVPFWDYLLIGSIGISLPESQRIDIFNDVFPKIKIINPLVKILYFPNAPLTLNKDNGVTGNFIASKVGTRVLNRFMKVRSGRIKPTMII